MTRWEDENIPEPLSRYNKRRKGKRKRILTEQELEEGVVGICSGRLVEDESPDTVKNRSAHLSLQVYIEKYSTFWRSRPKNWRTIAEKSPGALGCCSRASIQAEMCGATIEDYMEAQFWFFNTVFARPPRYSEIAGPGALLRYKQWRVAKVHGEAPTVTVNVATGGIYDPKKTLPAVVLAYETKVLERMSKRWGGEEQVWKLFGKPGDEEVFSDVFKETRLIWKAMYLKE